MSDQDESRPLTRRELRLREMAAAGAEPEAPEPVVEAAPVETPGDAAEAVASSADEAEIEISLFDENGRMRSRRELRELRAQAEERAAAEAAAETGSAVEAEAVVEAEAAVETDAAVEPSAGEQPEAAQAETEEAESEAVEAEAGEQVEVQSEPAGEAENETEAAPEPIVEPELAEGLEQLGFEQPGADAPGSEPKPETQQASEEPLAETVAFDVIAEEQAVETEPAVTGEVILEDEQDVAVAEEIAAEEETAEAGAPEEPAAEERSPEPVPEPVPAQPSQGYSFPDIAPLDEGQSVFDDPAIRMMGAAGAQQAAEPAGGDFDELINRAVAQEGASSTSNTAALILPNMPESEGLAGPLGDTGELFITGSIDLPKSLGETGGHSALHDSVEIEPLDELGISETAPAGGGMAPVSASRAVSARGSQGPLVADASKDKSKMPVVLIATGGVLVLGAVGLIVWAATSGLFG